MTRRRFAALALALAWLACGLYVRCPAEEPQGRDAPRPAAWATPLQRPGLPNLHKVSDGLYRGAQPTAEGLRELAKMGIKTVVNLRALHSDRDELGDTGLAYEHIPMNAWNAETEDVVRFLQIVTDRAKTPVFVHCLHGADRTGTMCAVYRVVVQNWSKDEAIREMKEGGFGHHSIFRNLPRFIEGLDVEALRRKAGLTK
ncbi:MAG TPA: dual specificity protein phosphatase family protein [Planctomycetota bacterium]|nr:dual specificity protein phosphatase family protein [Planctomycetota bacterium]HRR80341.1 dual specificity protein phosphatase family protein [Planctomycetota bacterium]HRT94147.1 dual specificity protein phosphatase family protein [Planctomycetota bacterium]